jgi:hypothetical protein
MKVKAIMLPSNKSGRDKGDIIEIKNEGLAITSHDSAGRIGNCRRKELYLVSDSEICKDEYYISENDYFSTPFQIFVCCNSGKYNGKNPMKIVATTHKDYQEEGMTSIPQSFIDFFIKTQGFITEFEVDEKMCIIHTQNLIKDWWQNFIVENDKCVELEKEYGYYGHDQGVDIDDINHMFKSEFDIKDKS